MVAVNKKIRQADGLTTNHLKWQEIIQAYISITIIELDLKSAHCTNKPSPTFFVYSYITKQPTLPPTVWITKSLLPKVVASFSGTVLFLTSEPVST